MPEPSCIYRVCFYNQGQVYEVYARQVFQSDLVGFIEVGEFVFGERSQHIVDPAEERLKTEFANVRYSMIPIQAVVRIDEVDKAGQVRISEVKPADKVAQFPLQGRSAKPAPRPQKDS
ncbi:MAG: DUF1820 family protein [Cellvibrionales bacterium]|nr:DUF1820 family protein [Cellvibrionales bacterium]